MMRRLASGRVTKTWGSALAVVAVSLSGLFAAPALASELPLGEGGEVLEEQADLGEALPSDGEENQIEPEQPNLDAPLGEPEGDDSPKAEAPEPTSPADEPAHAGSEEQRGGVVEAAWVSGTISGLPKLPKGHAYEMTLVKFDKADPPTTAKGFWQDVSAKGAYKAEMWVPKGGTQFGVSLYKRDDRGAVTFIGFLPDASGSLLFTLKPGQKLTRNLPYKKPTSSIHGTITAQKGYGGGKSWPAVEIYQKVEGHWLQVQDYYGMPVTSLINAGYYHLDLLPGTFAVRCIMTGFSGSYVNPGDVKKSIWWNLKPNLASANKITLKSNSSVKASCDMNANVPSPYVSRRAGANRYETSAAVSRAGFSPSVPVAYVAFGGNFPDALTGAPAAAKAGGPVLLTKTDSIPPVIATELKRLKPKRIVVLGGKGVVSTKVERELAAYSSGGANSVTREAGPTRFQTAVKVSQDNFSKGVSVAFVASGMDFPDALSGAPAAALEKSPVLLTRKGAVPPEVKSELKRLAPKRIVVLGGSGVVTNQVAKELSGLDGAKVQRWWGSNRYATSAQISKNAFPKGSSKVYIANGSGFPDALSAGPVAGRGKAPILLVRKNNIPPEVQTELRRLKPKEIVIVGGTGVVSSAVQGQLGNFINR